MADNPNRERKMGLPVVERGGRFFTKYDPNIALDIVERIADGELLVKITAKDALPLTITKQTFLRWVSSVPELQTAYSAALQLSAHAFEEKAIDKAEKTAAAPGTPQNVSAASLLISQYRWSAARRNPTRYSDKGNTQIVVPVNINTTLDMGSGKGKVDVEVPDIYTISVPASERSELMEGEFEEISDQQPQAEADEIAKAKAQFRDLIRPDLPTIGHQRQPLLVSKNKGGHPPGPRKRVLTPRIKKETPDGTAR